MIVIVLISVLSWFVVIEQWMSYDVWGEHPDSQAVTVVVVLDEDCSVIPAGTVMVKVEMVSPTANQLVQSHI